MSTPAFVSCAVAPTSSHDSSFLGVAPTTTVQPSRHRRRLRSRTHPHPFCSPTPAPSRRPRASASVPADSTGSANSASSNSNSNSNSNSKNSNNNNEELSSSPTSTAFTATPAASTTTTELPKDSEVTQSQPLEALQRLPLKRVVSWLCLILALSTLRSFFPVIVGTFILSYVTNSVVQAVSGRSRNRMPRRAVVGIFYAIIVTAISGFSLMTIPTVVRESNYFISTLQSENPYVYVANSLRKTLGDELTTKVEAYVMYSTSNTDAPDATAAAAISNNNNRLRLQMEENTIIINSDNNNNNNPSINNNLKTNNNKNKASSPASASAMDSSAPTTLLELNKGQKDASPSAAASDDAEWTQARSRRLGMLLQKSLRTYIAGTASLITKLIRVSTKVVFKAILSLIFSFMIMWDLPVVTRGIQRLRRSRLSFMYDELAPVVVKFGSVLGKSFEAQGLIALVNTTLTTAGLLVLSIPGVGFLSLVTLICSFIPVAGVFISTFPMCVIALSEFGVAKALAVIVMVILVHIVEAYVLNPQIYSAHLHLHPLVVLSVLYIAEHSYGIPGLLLAVPVAVYFIRTIMLDEPQNNNAKTPVIVAAAGAVPAAKTVGAGAGVAENGV